MTRPRHLTLIRHALAAAALLPCALLAGPPPALAMPPTTEATDLVTEDVTFRNGDHTIAGTVIAPAGEGADRPGIVVVAGAGDGLPRDTYRPHAEAFARAGIVTLVYDKRGPDDGYSLFDASIADLADDAIAGVDLLRDRPDVDPDQVGVHGHSEGGWTVLEVANRSPRVAFVVAAAPSGLTPDRTQVWMNQVQLQHAGVTDSLLAPLGANLTRHVVAADMFRLAGHDPVPSLERLDQPLLLVVAEHDTATPPGETLRIYRDTLDRAGHDRYTLRVVPDAHHELVPSRDGFDIDLAHLGNAAHVYDFAPGYVETVTDWVHARADGPPEPNADAPPAQPLDSAPLRPAAGYESTAVLVVAPALFLLAFGAYPLSGLLVRLRDRLRRRSRSPGHEPTASQRPAPHHEPSADHQAPHTGQPSPADEPPPDHQPSSGHQSPGRWPARALAVGGLVIPPLTLGYLGYLMIVAGLDPLGPVVAGRPLPWLLLQLATLGMVMAAIALVARWWPVRRTGTRVTTARRSALVAATVVFLPWAAYWGLLTP